MLDSKGMPLTPPLVRRVQRSWGETTPPLSLVPPCFPTKRSFILWIEMWTQRDEQASGFCVDCTKERKAAMVAQGRCSFPNVTFDRDSDGFPRGNR